MKRFLLLLVFLSQLVFADDSYLIDDSLAMARQGEFVRASNLIVDLANNGDSNAQYVLSMYFRDPNALNIPELGEMWLMRAAENNNADAQYDFSVPTGTTCATSYIGVASTAQTSGNLPCGTATLALPGSSDDNTVHNFIKRETN